jgi:hypothetical protein
MENWRRVQANLTAIAKQEKDWPIGLHATKALPIERGPMYKPNNFPGLFVLKKNFPF